MVNDVSALAMAEVAARGFRVYRQLDNALEQSSLIISATGQGDITTRALNSVRSGTVIATVTSADDEFASGALSRYRRVPVSKSLTRYENDERRYFWLLVDDGDAANFLDDAVIGPAIQLIEGQKLAARRGELNPLRYVFTKSRLDASHSIGSYVWSVWYLRQSTNSKNGTACSSEKMY